MQIDNSIIIAQVENLTEILKPWNECLVIGGGVALILYDTLLAKSNSGAVGTTDIDYLIPRKPLQIGNSRISKILIDNGYEPRNKSLDQPQVQSFIKSVENIEIEVEFLTDCKSRKKENVVVIENIGVHAQCLSYVEMSLKETIPLKLSNTQTVSIVRPEAWVYHKGLTFPKRVNAAKKLKDLYGIWFVLSQLGSVSMTTQRALLKLMQKHPENWRRTFYKNIRTWIGNASPRDWDLLASQDQNGILNKAAFLSTLNLIGIFRP